MTDDMITDLMVLLDGRWESTTPGELHEDYGLEYNVLPEHCVEGSYALASLELNGEMYIRQTWRTPELRGAEDGFRAPQWRDAEEHVEVHRWRFGNDGGDMSKYVDGTRQITVSITRRVSDF